MLPLKSSFLIVCLLLTVTLNAQVTEDNNIPNATNYVGFDASSGIPLPIRNDGDPRITLSSNGNDKMNFNELATWNGINGMTENDVSRIHLGLNGNFQNPFSLLHMGENISTSLQRPWMNVGLTMGASEDFMHIGLLQRAKPSSSALQIDAVIAWGCNDDNFAPANGPDNLRFLFLTPTSAAPPVGGSDPYAGHFEQGREVLRIEPMGNVGIGDFSHMPTGLDEQPTQKLDVDGTARLRQMPDNPPNVLITGVEQDTDPEDGDYVLNYLEFPNDENFVLVGDGTWIEITNTGDDCDWELIENVPDVIDVITGHGDDCFPAGHVGIGITEPQAKLDVFHGQNQVNPQDRAINSFWAEPEEGEVFGEAFGIHSFLRRVDTAPFGFGIYSEARFAIRNFAGSFLARASDNTGSNVGVLARAVDGGENLGEAVGGRFIADHPGATGASTGVEGSAIGGDFAYGVVGGASGGAQQNWAGFFTGDVFLANGWQPSDQGLKQNITAFEGGLDLLNQIEIKSYQYQTDQYDFLHLPQGEQYGVIAQQLEEVLPNLVKAATSPAVLDTLGVEIQPSVGFKTVNYSGLIPILISGIKEQQAQIQEQENELDEMKDMMMQMHEQMLMLQQQIDGCCMDQGWVPKNSEMGQQDPMGKNELYQNTPNPFRNHTTIRYTLEQGGRVMLKIHDGNGREVAQLENAEQSAGTYTYVWDAAGLPAGLYHYTLFVDDELLVKRAIKLHD